MPLHYTKDGKVVFKEWNGNEDDVDDDDDEDDDDEDDDEFDDGYDDAR